MGKLNQPDYRKIYSDIIKKYPEKMELCRPILLKEKLSILDVIKINTLIFGNKNKELNLANQKHRSYDKVAICEILKYQKEHKLNNSQLAIKFKLSRNSVAKWKKIFVV